MKILLCIALILPAISCELASNCVPETCKLENGCICTSTTSPIDKTKTPQFVLLTFDDAVTRYIYDTYYVPLLLGRKNPDSNPIGATFFVPHEYTDYECVNLLYNKGFEIGVHSITKSQADYWQNADKQLLVDEFSGQKSILKQFANVNEKDIQGVRVPFLQLAGDKTFLAYKESGLSYDSSWTSLSKNKIFPYTLDYASKQDCIIGSCPVSPIPKFFVSPINNLVGKDNMECNSLHGCQKNETATGIKDWLVEQFKSTYENERSPFKLLVNSAWLANENNLNGFELFLNYLDELNEVFIVSESAAIEWSKNPVDVANYKTIVTSRNAKCVPITCPLPMEDGSIRYMRSCVNCPNAYPWVGNPAGN